MRAFMFWTCLALTVAWLAFWALFLHEDNEAGAWRSLTFAGVSIGALALWVGFG